VNLIGFLILGAILVATALWAAVRNGGSRLYPAIAAIPLFLVVVVPLPFAITTDGSINRWQKTMVAVSRAGVALSVVLFLVGAVLTLRAAIAGQRRSAIVLALETALAGLPAAIFAASALLWLL
jgi:hypothetical protein